MESTFVQEKIRVESQFRKIVRNLPRILTEPRWALAHAAALVFPFPIVSNDPRSEERRVGKECRL